MPSDASLALQRFLTTEMRMSHVYQPVMLRALLEGGGTASVSDIASAFLALDQSRREYYEEITKQMPGPVLTRRGLVQKGGRHAFRFQNAYQDLTHEERAELIRLCEQKVRNYLDRRGDAPWSHRLHSSGYVPGSLLRHLGPRQRALRSLRRHGPGAGVEVDHIVPRNRSGSDDPSNLQALCFRCNAQKRDRDDTDFRAVRESYAHREAGCPFCELPAQRILAENELAVAIRDDYPVTPLHTLVMPKRHVANYFDLHAPERNAIEALLHIQRKEILRSDKAVDGLNVGINAGEAAGQTIFHVHVHLILRRAGDVEKPRGGVRGVIPTKQSYEHR